MITYYITILFFSCSNFYVVELQLMAWDAVVPHAHLENHRHLSSLVESNETSLWPSATGLSSLLSSLDRNRGRLWWPNVESEASPPSSWVVHPCLVIDGYRGRCSHKEVVHLELSLLIFASLTTCLNSKCHAATTHTQTCLCIHKFTLNPVH